MRVGERAGKGVARFGALPLAISLIAGASEADAATARILSFGDPRSGLVAILFSIIAGLAVYATVLSILHMGYRRRHQGREAQLATALHEARTRLDRAETFLAAEHQITIVWGFSGSEPDVEGDTTLVSDAPIARRVLAFTNWLSPDQAGALDTCVRNLRERGESFHLALVALTGRHLEAEGRAVAGRAVMRIREVSGDRLEAARLRESLAAAKNDLEMFKHLLNSVPCPAWVRDTLGRLAWTNHAYVRAVEARSVEDALQRRLELLESPTREASTMARDGGETYRARTAAVVAGWRRSIDVVEVPHGAQAIGIAFDVSDLEAARIDLAQMAKAHARTLDQLSTAVAIFDRRKQLVFHNSAYRQLWGLDLAFLETNPSESEILDRLRARRLLPEQADFRAWKEAHLANYTSPDTTEQVWYLPDGRTLRAVINPNPQSGVTYLFDDVTEHFHLESKFNAQTRVQRETLDTLKEGVAVFGTDGRLKLSNAAFAGLWHLTAEDLDPRPHIDKIADMCARRAPDAEPWAALRLIVAGLHDRRTGAEYRLTCRDGSIVDCTAAPLPDGATLLTFTDTTASVNVERALTERNQALMETEQLRNDFVHHVSYELRSPLTNIIGFIQLLGDGSVGTLNPKQSEYVGYVLKSSAALLAIINDILDLATIDTGALELNPKEVDIVQTIHAAAEGVQDRLAESALNLQIVALPNVGSFTADPKRVRQILFNLLSNAIGFSSPGQTVTLAAMRRGDEIVFKVADQGRGIPHDLIPHVFDRFQSHTVNSRHRGVGLGLSIVKSFVELHGGRVMIDSVAGEGTTVTCIFPAQHDKAAGAPEARTLREN